jgi:hypothetical protein
MSEFVPRKIGDIGFLRNEIGGEFRRCIFVLSKKTKSYFSTSIINFYIWKNVNRMSLQTPKQELVSLIERMDNEFVISKILELIKQSSLDFWTEMTAEQQEEIQEGIAELKAGKRISLDDFLKKVS